MSKKSQVREKISFEIQRFLKEKNISKAQFGRMLGVTATSINRYIKMECVMEIELIPQFCNLVNISLYDIFSIEEEKYSQEEKELINKYRNDKNISILLKEYETDSQWKKTIDYLLFLKENSKH